MDQAPSRQPPADPARRHVSRKTRRSPWPRRLVVLVLLACAGVAAWYAWRGGDGTAPVYLTVAPERGAIEDTIMALGTLQPRDYVDVGTQVSGQLDVIHVRIGDHVEEGDLLAEIDPTIYESQVEASQAELLNLQAQAAEQRARLVLAQQQLAREQALMAENATSREALETAQAEADVQAAQVQAIAAQIKLSESHLRADEANLGYTKIYAPMTGTVVSEDSRQGQTLNANQSAPIILRIADLSVMTVWTQVSEADIGRLHVGMDVYFTTLGRPDTRWYGTLAEIRPTPEVENNVVLYNALFDVANPDGVLMSEMTAQVFFVRAAAEDSLIVPIAALDQDASGAWTLQVLRADGSVERRAVEVGVTNRVSAEVLSGLEEGEQVIVGVSAGSDAGGGSGRFSMPRLG